MTDLDLDVVKFYDPSRNNYDLSKEHQDNYRRQRVIHHLRDIPSGDLHTFTSEKARDSFAQTRRAGVLACQYVDHLPVVDVLILDAEGYKAFLEQTATEGAA